MIAEKQVLNTAGFRHEFDANGYRIPYQVNPLYETIAEGKRRPGARHQNGTCGYMGSLCSDCHEQEAKWHIRVARAIAAQYPPADYETTMGYWNRVGGRWLDTWPEAVTAAFMAAGIGGDRLGIR